MEPAASVKRKRATQSTISKCIICQKDRGGCPLRQATQAGVETLRNSLATRVSHNCTKFLEAIDRLQDVVFEKVSLVWHKDCFSSFTSKTHLERLKRRSATSSVSDNTNETHVTTTRSSVSSMQWEKCIFCQLETGDALHQVQTLEASSKVMLNAKNTSPVLCYRVAGVADLVAAEAKYHLKCYVTFFRKAEKQNAGHEMDFEDSFQQACFQKCMAELTSEFRNGNIFSIRSVWNRYCELLSSNENCKMTEIDSNILRSFRTRVKAHFGERIDIVENGRKRDSLLLLPNLPKHVYVKNLVDNAKANETEQVEKDVKSVFLSDDETNLGRSLYHLVSLIRADIHEVVGDEDYDVIDSEHAMNLIPQSLFLLVSMLLGENSQPNHHDKIISIAQDIIHVASKGRVHTPKHLGIGLAVHHATRSKSLVNLLHASGNSISYDLVQRVETSIANHELERFKANDNVVVPRSLTPGRFLQFAGDNINILEETLDGKGQFNATQIVAFQDADANTEGITSTDSSRTKSAIGKDHSIKGSVPSEFHETLDSGYSKKRRPSPIIPLVELSWFKSDVTDDEVLQARCQDLSWILSRLTSSRMDDGQVVPAWTSFNQVVCPEDPSSGLVSVASMPILQAKADDPDTVYTVLARCKYISESLGQKYTVVTFDQAIYCKAKEIVWMKGNEFRNTIIRLGGFHIIMNFMKAIGQHLDGSGLKNAWTESGVFGEITVGKMIDGSAYNKAVRGHKIAVEALWRLLWVKFETWCDENNKSIPPEVRKHAMEVAKGFKGHDIDGTQKAFQALTNVNATIFPIMEEFERELQMPQFQYWLNYMNMVSILLQFIRAEREGNWPLHLASFSRMLPWFALYNHTNYSRWGPVYLADMHQLPQEIHQLFLEGKFSVKKTRKRFCRVSVDQALEHVNKVAKISGGIIGISKRNAARDKWSLTYNEKSRLAEEAYKMFGIDVDKDVDEEWCQHQELGPTRLKRDEEDLQKVMEEFQKMEVFTVSQEHDENLVCIGTKDVVPESIKVDILKAEKTGTSLVEAFVSKRLIEGSIDFYAPLSKNKTPSISRMYNVRIKSRGESKQEEVIADRNLMQRLLVAAQSGRGIDMNDILKHELAKIPRALASTKQKLHSTDKAQLQDLLIKNIEIPKSLPESITKTCLIIDAQAQIQAMGKPEKAVTFGDLSDEFCSSIKKRFGSVYSRVDVIFDRYQDMSIKSDTREKRVGKTRPIRRVISSRDVKLPSNFQSFLSLSANKADLASFLSEALVKMAPELQPSQELVISGGFVDVMKVWTSSDRKNHSLSSNHEEADTRIVLHAKDALLEGYQRCVIQCRDTDVLVLALGHRSSLPPEVWMSTGLKSKKPFIPVHKIELSELQLKTIIPFHALTGCDTVSQFASIGKKTAWKIFREDSSASYLLQLGSKDINAEMLQQVEKFVCQLYLRGTGITEINQVRKEMFLASKKSLDALPPTKDALDLHIQRANYQSLVWKQALTPVQDLPEVTSSGWIVNDGGDLRPNLMTLSPLPDACKELISCSCKTVCGKRCGCVRAGHKTCITLCKCKGTCTVDEDE